MNRAKNYHFTSALGQIDSELVPALKRRCGMDHIVDSDIRILAVSGIDAALSEFALFVQRQKKMSGYA